MNKKVSLLIKALVIVIVLTLFNCAALVLSYCLPTGAMREHVAQSTPLIEAEIPYLQWDTGYTTTQIDGWSEYNLYGMAINEDAPGNALEKAMFMYFMDGENLPRDVSIAEYAKHSTDVRFDQRSYSRYWNGSVIFLKLLLLKFTIPDIRMINFMVQIVLLMLVVGLMVKNGLDKYLLPFMAAVVFINPFTMALSVKFATEYIPMLLCIIVILAFGSSLEKKYGSFEILFAITGSVTAFMCMLSFPGISLGIPLLFLVWRNKEKNIVKTVFNCSFFWGLAYAVTWSMKWIIGNISTSHDFLAEAGNQMIKYQGDRTVEASAVERVMRNLWCIYNPVYVLFFGAMILVIVISMLIKLRKKDIPAVNVSADIVIGYILIALIPFAIIIALGNGYAYVHAYMAHRQLSIAVAAGICLIKLVGDVVLSRLGKKVK